MRRMAKWGPMAFHMPTGGEGEWGHEGAGGHPLPTLVGSVCLARIRKNEIKRSLPPALSKLAQRHSAPITTVIRKSKLYEDTAVMNQRLRAQGPALVPEAIEPDSRCFHESTEV